MELNIDSGLECVVLCGTEILSQVKYIRSIVINIISANNGGNRWYIVLDVGVPDVSKNLPARLNKLLAYQ